MAKRLHGEQLKRRNALVRKWKQLTTAEIQKRCRAKFGTGIHFHTIKKIQGQAPPKPKPKPKPKETALVLAAPSGLVPAREVSPRLRAMLAKAADLMVEERILTASIEGRRITITHTPEEQVFEV